MDLTTAHAKDRTKAGFTYVGSAGLAASHARGPGRDTA